jgi:hypothetical protein
MLAETLSIWSATDTMKRSLWLTVATPCCLAFIISCSVSTPDANDVETGADHTIDRGELPSTEDISPESAGTDLAPLDVVPDVAPDVPPDVPTVVLDDLASIAELDELSLFTFMIFSDNKGDAPGQSLSMTGVDLAIGEMDARFAIGLGDHLKGGSRELQGFVPFVTSDPWWSTAFYPNIADGENAYYGSGQGDWGAGAGLVDDLGLCEFPGVTCRDNHAEYHAVLEFDDITVHLVSVHYPDSGEDQFPEASRAYLVEEISGIEKSGKEIVVGAAHTGMWIQKLDPEDQELVLDRADLLLGATSHLYERYDYPDHQALFLNTGAAGYSLFNNYLQVNVLANPLRLIVQNMPAEAARTLQAGGNCWVKIVGGLIEPCNFNNGKSWGMFGED